MVTKRIAVHTEPEYTAHSCPWQVKETPDATQHAYIVFKDASSVAQALKKNMQVFMTRHLRVDTAVAPQKQV